MSPPPTFTAEMLASLVEASAAINAAQDLDETLAAIARSAAEVLKAEASSVIMLDPARRKQVFLAATGDRADQVLNVEFDEGVGISGRVLETGQAAIVNDVTSDGAHYKGVDAVSGFTTRSLIAAPLIHQNRRFGAVEILNPSHGGCFTDTDAQLAQVFGNLAAISVANSELCDRLKRDNLHLRQTLKGPVEMIGTSEAIEQVRNLIRRVAPSNATVLLLGETGTGKELAARMVHANSERASRPFVAVNCAALPHTLLESELFGHEAGAFTGANQRKLGRFELADGGVLFLDEIAEVPPDVQVKLLRVLQEKEIVRVGGVTPIACDVRVVAATNRDLAAMMEDGSFRKDLFYRLNVFPITLPPLRDRQDDIPQLAEFFLKQIAAEMKIPVPRISPEAVGALARHEFQGNVRELQNILERGCLLGCLPEPGVVQPGCIEPRHLPPEIAGGQLPAPAAIQRSALEANEKAMILSALGQTHWNQTQAAELLGISRDNIRYRIKKYGLKRP